MNAGKALPQLESAASWMRLAVCALISAVGSVGMWSVVVVLPTVQDEFAVARADASLPFTLAMLGFGFGNVAMGRLADRFGITVPVICGALSLCAGYLGAAWSPGLWMFAAAHFLIGLGSGASFGPLMADISHWFVRRRGIAVAIAAAGNYVAGTIWPPIVQHFTATAGWRPTHIAIGVFCLVALVPLSLLLLKRAPEHDVAPGSVASVGSRTGIGLSPNALMILLCVAGVGCCVAMSMPQVHIVAYCGDLGYGVARGAEMLSLMLAFGIVSRVASGFIADRIGGLGTLLLGSIMQALALLMYLAFDGLTSLYVISALFGLFQGGIVPSYAIIVREFFPPREAATRVGIIIFATVIGMALGGWMSGYIFDLTGSYAAAFLNGVLWNLLNVAIAVWLLLRSRSTRMRLAAA
jgi:MFS family permease